MRVFLAAAALSRPHGPVRRASQAARRVAVRRAADAGDRDVSVVDAFATASKERPIANGSRLRSRASAKTQADPAAACARCDRGDASLAEFVTSSSEDRRPPTDRAFIVWSQTELATYRITSAVELYGAERPTGKPLCADSS